MRSFARVARPVASQQLRQFSARTAARPSMLAAPAMMKSQKIVSAAPQWSQMRFASGSALSKDDIKARVLDVLKSFEKVDPAKVSWPFTLEEEHQRLAVVVSLSIAQVYS